MSLDVSKVLVGAPDQMVTGAILDAPVGTSLPESATAQLDGKFSSSGYVDKDGVTVAIDRSTTEIPDWSLKTIREVLEKFKATLSWSESQMSKESLGHAFGEGCVHVEKATAAHGERIKLDVMAELPPVRSWVVNLKDGKARMRIVVPLGQVTSVDELKFVANDAVKLPITLTTYPDEHEVNVYIYTDDGVVTK